MEFQVQGKRLTGSGARPVLEYAVRETLTFTFDFDLAPEAQYTLSGDTEPLRTGGPVLLATGTLSEPRTLRFEVDTMTRGFLDKCRNFRQKLHLEIVAGSGGAERVLLQDWIECAPRINVSGTPPDPIDAYYTAAEVDAKLALITGVEEIPDLSDYAKKSDLPEKTSQLENDSGFLADAPADGNLYARKNSSWTTLVATETSFSAAEKTKLAALPTATELEERFDQLSSGSADLSGYYTRAEVDALLAEKLDQDDLPESPDCYSRDEIDAMFGSFESAAAAIIGEPE